MTGVNRPARLNRTLLAFAGLLLVAAGAVPAAIRFRWWPALGGYQPLVPVSALPPTLMGFASAATGVVVALLGLRWLAAQLARKPPGRVWRFDAESGHGHTELSSATAVAPFAEEVRAYPGVHGVTAALVGSRENPALEMVVSVEQDGDPADVRGRGTAAGTPPHETPLGARPGARNAVTVTSTRSTDRPVSSPTRSRRWARARSVAWVTDAG